jgi:primase-polymerase (primpol)-like protein
LREQAQWVAWRYEQINGRRTKIPYNPRDGHRARSNDPRTWGSADEAQAALAQGGYDGVGFMLRAGDPFVGMDLDHCFDPQTGALLPWAAEIVETLDSYTEVSPSGTGLRIFARGTLPPRELGRREGPVEMYSDRRFLSVTGQHLSGTPTTVEERGAEVAQVHRQVFHRRYEAATPPVAPSPSATGVTPALNDAAILDKLRRAKNGPSFERLWQGDTEGYASASEADLALCGMLAFYTQDPA